MKSTMQRLQRRKLLVDNHWRWNGAINPSNGAGVTKYNGKMVRVSRLVMYLIGRLPSMDSELLVLHKLDCPYKDCWNPDCLYTGDHMQNMSDKSDSITHCIRGHELSGYNLIIHSGGKRMCRACENDRQRRARHALKERQKQAGS